MTSENLYTYSARCLRVIDGDTFVAEIDLGFRLKVNAPVRLAGIDAPEIHPLHRWRAAFSWLASCPGGRVGESGPEAWYATFGLYPGRGIAVGTTALESIEALRKKVER